MARWRVRFARSAEIDLAGIFEWTAENFGTRKANAYRSLIFAALRELEQGPATPLAKLRGPAERPLYTLHIARKGRPGKHILLYRPEAGQLIQLLRILHESMDVERRLRED